MSQFKVTELGKANLLDSIELTSDTIELGNGTMGACWTMNALHEGNTPLDKEGWTPWPDCISVETATDLKYIEEIL